MGSSDIGTYVQYLRHLRKTGDPVTETDTFSAGYNDVLQAPLQPLMANLESGTYETFELDPVKYQKYEQAIERALVDLKERRSDMFVPAHSALVCYHGR